MDTLQGKEDWKVIEGFSRYEVSNEGEVIDTKHNKIVAKQLTGVPQYFYVNMNRDDGKRKLVRLHRLVATAFVEGQGASYTVDYLHLNNCTLYTLKLSALLK